MYIYIKLEPLNYQYLSQITKSHQYVFSIVNSQEEREMEYKDNYPYCLGKNHLLRKTCGFCFVLFFFNKKKPIIQVVYTFKGLYLHSQQQFSDYFY